MKILAVDTATEACSAALYLDGEIQTRYQLAPREHSRLILNMVDELLAESAQLLPALDAVAFGRGPGSFMGIRIATGVVQGMAFAHDLPVIPVSNLAAIAEVAYAETGAESVLTAIDARMGEVYWGAWQRDKQGNWENRVDESVCLPGDVVFPQGGQWCGAGTGWRSYRDSLEPSGGQLTQVLPDCLPSAEAIARIAVSAAEQGKTVTAAEAQPVYLRNNVAKKPQKKSFATQRNR